MPIAANQRGGGSTPGRAPRRSPLLVAPGRGGAPPGAPPFRRSLVQLARVRLGGADAGADLITGGAAAAEAELHRPGLDQAGGEGEVREGSRPARVAVHD